MGGSGSNDTWDSPGDIFKKIQNSNDGADKAVYDSEVSNFIAGSLGNFNNRDKEAIQNRIKNIKDALGRDIDGVISTRFGGSISKNTHIDGLSDIDTLVILNDSSLSDKSPAEVLDYFYKKLKQKYPDRSIVQGDTSVTINFPEGDIQLLPTLKYKSGIKISDSGKWSSIIAPSVFARKLTIVNQNNEGKLIPGIKLIKSIIGNFPESSRLKGYHIESLAVQIFSKYQQQPVNNVKDVVVRFFKEAPTLVKNPIKDTTGQTLYVDEYLGNKNNLNRMIASDSLERVSRRIEIAESGNQKEIWDNLVNGT